MSNCGGWSEKLSGTFIDKNEKTKVIRFENCEELVKEIISRCRMNRKT